MTALSTTLLADALKEYYTDKEIARLGYTKNPFLAMVNKDTKWTGKEHVLPIQYTRPAGRSNTFATAQANTAPSKYEAFKLTTVKDYGIVHVETEAIYASEGQPMRSFVEARKNEADGIIKALQQNLAMMLYRNGGNARGRRASLSTNTVTLTEPNDVVNFEVDMVVAADTTDGTSGSINAGTTTITAVDRDAGTITLASAAALTGFADNDYLFVAGDFGTGVSGLDAWLPSSAPGATAFFGVDRSVDTSRLGGIRYSDSNPLVEKIKRAVARVWREGATPDHMFINPADWVELEIMLGDRVQYDRVKSSVGEFMFDAIKIATPFGMVRVIGDPNCPKGVGYLLTLETWKFVSRGSAPRVLNPDNQGDWMRQGSSDGIEGRFGWFGQLGCSAPGSNARVALT